MMITSSKTLWIELFTYQTYIYIYIRYKLTRKHFQMYENHCYDNNFYVLKNIILFIIIIDK